MADLFSPVKLGDTEVPNRVVLPSMTTRLADEEGYATEAALAYYRARAAGGVGLVTVEMASPERAGRHRFHELGIYHDRFVPGLRRLVDALHAEGSQVSIQLGHAGSRARGAVSQETPVAPSAVRTPVFEIEQELVTPQAMSAQRLEQAIAAFVAAAHRARQAGFDAVELHGAHGYLISQFLSPLENRRTDDYGGSLANRARFGLEILHRIKNEVPGLAVVFRIGVEDFFEGGLTAEEGVRVAAWAAETGADAVSVTAGHYRSQPSAERMIPPMRYPQGVFLDFAARVRRSVQVPVIGVGRLGDPALARRAVAEGTLDLVALGRPLLADPEWVAKARAGEPVRRCLACNHCIDSMRSGARLSCVVNPVTGHELDFADAAPPSGQRICVLGAGPAGLSYASLVAEDNEVTVVERSEGPGGAFQLVGRAPRFNDVWAEPESFADYISELQRDCRTKGVRFRYGTDAADAEELLRSADRVAVATGARYRFGLRWLVTWLLRSGLARSAAGRRLFDSRRLRDWLYYRARTGTGSEVVRRLGLDPGKVVVLGDAYRAGKAREAISTAFDAALRTESASERARHSIDTGHEEVARS